MRYREEVVLYEVSLQHLPLSLLVMLVLRDTRKVLDGFTERP